MKLIQLLIASSFCIIMACESDSAGPETDCIHLSIYDLDYHFVTAAKIYDIRETPPLEIQNGTLEYDLFYQWQGFAHAGENPPPYNYYTVYTAFFSHTDAARLHYTNVDFFDYEFVRDDCQIDFFRPNDTIHAELIDSGNEIAFDRYAIYDHSIAQNGSDTFTFIEFRNQLFKSYKQIIAEFAKDNPGKYDTIGIELVSSRTRE